MTLDEALTRLYAACGGADPAFAAVLAAARAPIGVPDEEVGELLPRSLHALASGLSPPEPIPPQKRGFEWLLPYFVELIPTAHLINEVDHDGLAVPGLGRALVIYRGGDDRWAVVPWPP